MYSFLLPAAETWRCAQVWGGIVRSWLDEILPDDAAERCSGRVHISILQLMPPERKHVSWFCSKADLIEACLASSHLPWVMDGRACFHFRGSPCVDGSILASRSATALPEHLQQVSAPAGGGSCR